MEFNMKGLVPPVFTPLLSNGKINYQIIPVYAQYLRRSGFDAILVGGTTGENMSLSVADRKELMSVWVNEGIKCGFRVQAQVGGAPLPDVLELAKYAQSIGIDSLLTLPELYFKPSTVESLVFYLQQIAEAAPNLPILYYHIPSFTNVQLSMPKFVQAATARIPNFKGLKFTSNDLCEGAQTLRSLNHTQQMFLGADTLLAPGALLGIKSSIGTTLNMFPLIAQQILLAVEKGDVTAALKHQETLSMAVEAITSEGDWVPSMKAAMEIVTGITMGSPCLPQTPISNEARQRLETKLNPFIQINSQISKNKVG